MQENRVKTNIGDNFVFKNRQYLRRFKGKLKTVFMTTT